MRKVIPGDPSAEPSLCIREAGVEDAQFVRELSDEGFSQFGEYDTFLPSYLGHAAVFAAIGEERGTPVGFVMLAIVASRRSLPWQPEPIEEDCLDAEILAVAVRSTHQSRGFGRRLMQYAVRCAEGWHQAMDVRSLQLNVAHTNERAIRLFSRMGFVVVDPEDGTYPKGQRSIRMGLRLSAG